MPRSDASADLQRWRNPPVYRLLSMGTLLKGNHQNKVWRGIAQTPGSTEPGIPMVIKWVPKNEVLAAELACALAGRALKLQVPPGVLVLAQKSDLPDLPRRVSGAPSDLVVCYGSELQWPDDTVARPTQAPAVEEWTWQRLCDTPQGPAGGVWDELVANDDRHYENVVFDGNKWWLIDHEYTLPSVAKVMKRFAEQAVRQTVVDDHAKQNILAEQVLRRRPKDHKMDHLPASWLPLRQRLQWLADQAQRWQTNLQPVDTVLMMTHIYLRSIDLRLPALALHLRQRLAQPDSASLWNSSSTSRTRTPTPRRPV
jgi:hypothetical protein